MAKLRSVTGPFPLPRSEEEFLASAPIALPEIRNTTPDEARNISPPDEVRNTIPTNAGVPDDGLVSVTIRIPRHLHDALAARAAADERSMSQIARRLLAPLLK
jgi:hypothetical protein